MACPKCGSNDRYQEIDDPCDVCKKKTGPKDEFGICDGCSLTSVSFLVCRKCGFREYDD